MTYNYTPRFIEDKTVEELEQELEQMDNDLYAFGITVDRNRLWDIRYTIKTLKAGARC